MEVLPVEKPKKFSYEVATGDSVSAEEIVDLIQRSVPKEWLYEGMKEEYAELLKRSDALIVSARKDRDVCGLIAGVPHNDVAMDEDFQEADPDIKEDFDRMYIEAALIDPNIQKTLAGGRVFFGMIDTFIAECQRRGITKFSTHARICNELSAFLKRYIEKHSERISLEQSRKISEWKFYGGTESIEYLEFSLK